MPAAVDQTVKISSTLHLRRDVGRPLVCGGPDGLWTRRERDVTCPDCLAAVFARRLKQAAPVAATNQG